MAAESPASMIKNPKYCRISYPTRGILLVLINRPAQLNSLTVEANFELDAVFRCFDQEPRLHVAVIGGIGKTFSVGTDFKEWTSLMQSGTPIEYPENGFAGISLREGRKPIIAAVNGAAFGGGCELVLNCDLVVAAKSATFAVPEVKRGLAPFGGGLQRLMKTLGRQLATELALTGRAATADEFRQRGLCNAVVEDGDQVVDKALEYARIINENSMDAIIAVKEGLKLGWSGQSMGEASQTFRDLWSTWLTEGENCQEGLKAFLEKRKPEWKDSKL